MLSRLSFRFTILSFGFLLMLCGCAGDDGSTDAAGGEDVMQEDVAGDAAVPEVVEDLAGLPDEKPEDIPEKDEQPQGPCDPGCVYGNGEYCDEQAGECVAVECAYCLRNKDCGDGGTCLSYEFDNGPVGMFCTNDCTGDGDCAAGFGCDDELGMCVPAAYCEPSNCGNGSLGDPCFYEGGINEACGDCEEGLFCMGFAINENTDCSTDQECFQNGYGSIFHPDCVKGFCGASFCVGKCTDWKCPDGFEAVPGPGIGSCLCQPTGTGEAGAPCPFGNIYHEYDDCGPGTNCLGIPAEEQIDEETGEAWNPCETDADCSPEVFNGNPICVDGFCGTSFCAPYCDANGDCESGYLPLEISSGCFCQPVPVGEAGPGDACSFYGEVNQDADYCEGGLQCLGIVPDEDTAICGELSDCGFNSFPGGTVCDEGHCGTSFCSPKCDVVEGEDGEDEFECDDEFDTIFIGEKCYCQPFKTGDGVVGEPCPAGNVNTDGDFCLEDLFCVGTTAGATADTCNSAADCPATYAPNGDCVEGYCGFSGCAAECDEFGGCAEGQLPLIVGGGACVCTGSGLEFGDQEAGEACAFINVAVDSGICGEGLACYGFGATSFEEECETEADCDPELYPGNIECIEGYCGSSFCSPLCNADFQCPPGFASVEPKDAACYCMMLPTGDSKVDEACNFGDVVNADSDYCELGLTCLGIVPDDIACTDAGDCAMDPYAGNPECIDGLCATSFCSALCDDNGECGDGYEVLELGEDEATTCYCIPDYTGETEAGEGCPLYNVNPTADFCAEGLDCIGSPAFETSDACVFSADCPDYYLGETICFAGQCGTSLCAAECGPGLACADGEIPWIIGEAACYCVPGAGGTAALGDSCGFLNVNSDEGACGAGLACSGEVASPSGDACESAEDCPAEDYSVGADCINGFCGYSYCAAACEEDASCADGFEPVEEDDFCFCAPAA